MTMLIIGMLVMFIFMDKKDIFHKYLARPTTEKLEWNWSTRKFLELFSKKMANRFYEAAALIDCGYIKSIFCGIGLIHCIRFDYMHNSGDYGEIRKVTLNGFRKLTPETLEQLQQEQFKDIDNTEYYPDSILVAGRNVVWDICSGYR